MGVQVPYRPVKGLQKVMIGVSIRLNEGGLKENAMDRRRFKRFLLLLCCILGVELAMSGGGYAKVNLDVKEKTLSNGLKVLVLEDHSTPTATFQVWYRVGSRNEVYGKTGISHMLEHMMFKGTHKYGPGEFSNIVARNGGVENAFTSRDYTAYFENWASDRIDVSMELESDRMNGLLLDEKEFSKERQVVMEERRMRTEDDPTSLLVEELFATAYKVHPYHWPVIGWMGDIESFTIDDLRAYYKAHYTPNDAVVVVVGDVDVGEVFRKMEKWFGPVPSRPVKTHHITKEPPQRGEKRVQVVSKEARLPFVMLAFHVPTAGSKDEYALEILASVLGDGKSSRIYRHFVREERSALFAGVYYSRMRDSGLFYFYVGLLPGKGVEEVEDQILQEIERVKRDGITPQELEKAKNQIEAGFVYGLDSNFYRAMTIGRLEVTGVGYRYLQTYVDNVRKVTAEQVKEVARKYFTEENRTWGVLLPATGEKDQ